MDNLWQRNFSTLNWIAAGAIGVLLLLSTVCLLIVLWRVGAALLRRRPRAIDPDVMPRDDGPPPRPLFPVE